MNIDKVIEEVLQQIPQPLWENWYIKEKIGSGSFSTVFRVEAVRAKRVDSAALKVEPIMPDERLASNEERSLSYLKQKRTDIEEESTIMYKLKDCPNVVGYEDEDVKEFFRDGKLAGYIFLIRMELLQNVYDIMNSQQLNTDEANIIRLAKEIGNGLKAAHDIGVIHRDVKPSNFFISENRTYKLGDFNIAKQTSYTRSFAGTEGYIAPEVYMAKSGNASAYSAQADIYSLGICLYQFMNNGLFPFENTVLTEEAIDRRMRGEELPPPSNASDSFSKIILKACAYEADTRYANMSEMLADLDKLNAPKADAYVSGAGFAAPKSTATVYTGNTSYSSGNETKYADSSVYMQSQVVETSGRSSKKAIITVSAIIALIVILGGLLAFVANNINEKNGDETVISNIQDTSLTAVTTDSTTVESTSTATTTTTSATSTSTSTTETTTTETTTTETTTTETTTSETTTTIVIATTMINRDENTTPITTTLTSMSNSASSLYDFGFSDLMSNSPIQALGSDCIRYSTDSCRKNGEVNIKVYEYNGVTITSEINGGSELIFSIVITNSNYSAGGITIGDLKRDVISAFGGDGLFYTEGEKQLSFNYTYGKVSKIEFFYPDV